MTLLHARAEREEPNSPGCDRMQWITANVGMQEDTGE